ncbi:Sua5/YciO/YrdC/YwlC family protein [Candidatus Gracilibacteria bacterium]|nr:Sua5/YciO/YrdC/YwlC family protein [Candidatus Gracilibacteria bacterium]
MIFAIPTDTCFGLGCSFFDEKGYFEIYNLKSRTTNKPLSFVVKDFKELEKITNLNKAQLNFLKNYSHPFTILTSVKENFILPSFLDKNIYNKVAFRVGEKCISKDLLDKINFPIFLTSANISGENEIYSSSELVHIFKNKNIKIFTGNIDKIPTSNIFEFIGETIEIQFHRKNY